MKYKTLITQRAQQEAQAHHDWWARHRSVEQAAGWYDEFFKAALSLESEPQRWTLAPENDRFPYEIRQLNFGLSRQPTHRIVYTIRPTEVVVLRVRHLAQAQIEID